MGLPFNPESMDFYERQLFSLEGRDFLVSSNIIGEMLENFSDHEGAPRLLGGIVADGHELPLKDLEKLYELSRESEVYKRWYDMYMDIHRGHGTSGEHLTRLRLEAEAAGDSSHLTISS